MAANKTKMVNVWTPDIFHIFIEELFFKFYKKAISVKTAL